MVRPQSRRLGILLATISLASVAMACEDENGDAHEEASSPGARIMGGDGLSIEGDDLVIDANGRHVPLDGAALVYGVHDGNIAIVDAGYGGGTITVLDATGDRVGGMTLAPRTAGVLIDDGIVTYRVTGNRPGSPHVLTFHDLSGNPRATAQRELLLVSATPDARGNLHTLNTTANGSVAVTYDATGQRLGADGRPEDGTRGDGHAH